MKKIVFGLVSLVFVFTMFPSFVGAQEPLVPTSTESSLPSTTAESNESESEKSKKLEQRVQGYKDKLSKRLTAAETKRITSVCKPSQAITAKLGTRAGSIKENRTQVYTKVSERLSGVVGKLQKAGVDTAELEASLDVLQLQIDQLLIDAEEYQTALNDSAEMDCASNPEAFKSALEEARAKRKDLFESSKAIRAYIQDSIKPLLQSLRQQLSQTTDTAPKGEN